MKKALLLSLMVTVLLLSITGCTGTSNTPSAAGSTKTTNITENSPVDPFSYLPKHPAMKLKEVKIGDKNSFDYAYYTVSSNVDFNKFTTDYKTILVNNGWTVTQEQAPTILSVQKDNHIAAMTFTDTGKDFLLVITSK